MKKNILFLMLFFCSCVNMAQTTKYIIPDVGYIYISDELELRDDDTDFGKHMSNHMKSLNQVYYLDTSEDIVFQNKGLNDNSLDLKSIKSDYARITIATYKSNKGDFVKAKEYLEPSTKSEQKEFEKEYELEMRKQWYGTKLKLIKLYEVNFTKINGVNVLKSSYLRQLDDNPLVVVRQYCFQNYDRQHIITLSYRESKETKWKPIMEKAINSFVLTNIR